MSQQTSPEQWRSRRGFIITTIAAAVGLGNVWRFSYVAGENGGATFLFAYLLCIVLVGAPIVIAELAIGRQSTGDAVATIETVAPGRLWKWAGILGILGSVLIMTFYLVVAGWALKYLVGSLTGSLWQKAGGNFGGYFEAFIANPYEPVIWQFVVMLLAAAVVSAGVQGGIEKLSRILLPMLAIIVFGLAIYSLTHTGAAQGLRFLFSPKWELLRTPDIYLAAMGQAFFSLSVGMALYLTYGSYLAKSHKLPGAAVAIIFGDTLMALLAGIAIFPAVFAFGLSPDSGPRLVFITLPQMFIAMPGGFIVGPLFFLLLSAAAISASVSGFEVPTAYLTRRFRWQRRTTAYGVGVCVFLGGVPASLGYGVWRTVEWQGKGILETMDYAVSNVILPIAGLMIAIIVGWRWGAQKALEGSDFGPTWLGWCWLWSLRILVPALILIVFLRGAGFL